MTINKCNNSSAPGPDRISWKHLEWVVKNNKCLEIIVNIANACINLGHWLLNFKVSLSIIIPKPNKVAYDSPKSFCPIVLLNTMRKLIEKVISKQIQYHLITNNFIHPNQLRGLKQWSTTDTDLFLTHLIWSRWVKNL